MALVVTSPAIDLGIVVHDLPAMLRFYGETLGLESLGVFTVPGGTRQHRFRLGESTLKLLEPDPAPAVVGPGGGIRGATGLRYWTAWCSGLAEVVADCEAAGSTVDIPLTTGSSGVRYAVLRDPDGNAFELIER